MKKGTLLLLVSVLLVTLSVTSFGFFGKKDSLKEVKKKGKFIVGLDDTFAPMGFRDEKGNIVGFDIDMAKAVAEKMGVEVEFKPCEWSGIIFELKSKNIDVVWNGMTITEQRQKQINFSKPYLANRQIIITLADSEVMTKAELAGNKLGLQLGSSADTAVSEDAIVNQIKQIRKYDTNAEALLDLEAGRVDAVVMDEIAARYAIAKKEKRAGKKIFNVLTDNFGNEEFGIGIRKEDESFRKAINEAIEAIIADGTAAKISEEWFGEDVVLK